jgi:hypothetical protein
MQSHCRGSELLIAVPGRNRLPSALKLDSDTFQPVMNPKHISAPLVVIAVVSERNRQNVISAIKPIGKQWREGEKYGKRDVVFAWMDGERWSSWLKSMYGIVDAGKAETPSVVIADHAVSVLCPARSAVKLTLNRLESCLLRRRTAGIKDPTDASKYRVGPRKHRKG